jgi:hypothetical protein
MPVSFPKSVSSHRTPQLRTASMVRVLLCQRSGNDRPAPELRCEYPREIPGLRIVARNAR